MFKIPKYAKVNAKNALELRNSLNNSQKFGLDKNTAKQLNINSGVERAKQLVNNKYLNIEDTKAVCRFSRWLNRERTQKVQGAIDLWGGDKFIKKACKYVKEEKNV